MRTFTYHKNIQRQFLWFLLMLSPLFLGAGGTYQKYQDEIAVMTQAERDRLLHNFDSYKYASNEAKNQLEQFYQALEADRSKGGTLEATLNDYIEWLNTISTFERAEIRDEKDPAKRVTLVEQILMKRETSNPITRAIPHILAQSPAFNKMFDRFRFGSGRTLSMIELDRIVDLLLKSMPSALPLEYQNVRSLRGSERVIKVLQWQTLNQTENKNGWVNDVLMEEIKKLIHDQLVLGWINGSGATDSKNKLLHLITRSAVFYEIEELARKKNLSQDNYETILKKSDDKMRFFLSSLPAAQSYQFISNFAVIQDVKEQKIKLKSISLLDEVSKKYEFKKEWFMPPVGGPPPKGRFGEGRDLPGEGKPPFFGGEHGRGGPRPPRIEGSQPDKPALNE